jgi:hypothetical protein
MTLKPLLLIEAVSAGGAVIKEMLILLAKCYLERWYKDLRDNVLISISESGYTNNELLYEYIWHFYHHLRKTQIRAH